MTTIPSPAMVNAAAPTTPAAPVAPVAPAVNIPGAPVAPAVNVAAPVAPVVNTAAPVVPEVAPTKEKKAKKETKPKEASREINADDIQFIMQNISVMPLKEIAEARGITKNQANRVVSDLRTMMRKAVLAKDPNAYPATGEMSSKNEPIYDYSSPLTADSKKVEEVIAAKLSRPEGSGVGRGGNKTGGGVKAAINDAFSNLFKELGI